ncbi:MAG: acyl-CoA thioesterase [Calditrichia bacterium]|jgi:acyl-CoA hydrolase
MSVNKKSPQESAVEMTELVLPNDTNLLGNLLGGRLMHWMDIAGGMSASRYANKVVVTAAVDNLIFHHPVKLGELVNLKAIVTWTGRTSMEILVKVIAENTLTGEKKLANEAFFTFVALDEAGKSCPVPVLLLKTDEEKIQNKEAINRRTRRLELKGKL